jgi:hypothetical protein
MNEEKKLEELFDLTNHPGWKLLISDLEERLDVMRDSLTRYEVTPYELGVAQGHIKVYRELKELRRMVELALQQHKEDKLDEAANV